MFDLQFSTFEFLARVAMEQELSMYQEMISNFVILNPEQRYAQWVNEHPKLAQRIPLHQLATFIGVAPETLSRIRKRISNKGINFNSRSSHV